VSGIVEATLTAMESLGASRTDTRAVIGPAISQRAYEVGQDFRQAALAEDPAAEPFFGQETGRGRPHFDLPGYVASRLARSGVGAIADLGICTYGDEAGLFSYRRSQHRGEPDYGRQISAIVLA
jgi:copper oxidase (laccase) domain-containing protein